ncbi:DNA protecting protein DprA [Solemya velesiana gill symbiont]|uniref:DNA protecting protein DprA n=1 Tax=Solemya velesiana gill symbiont TaxID=1918948 RepID=A0A1T2KXF0_9GAMM|nr:DNA protecting protein DprA [Solemya velesiana gill symbiont]
MAYWLALLHAPGLGSRGYNRLLKETSPQQVFENPGLANKLGSVRCDLGSYIRNPDWDAVETDQQWAEAAGHHIITLEDPLYPALLAEIDDPPPVLFVVGDPACLALPQLAMVGSRNPSASGRQTARDFAFHLARSGLAVTSGLAIGVDCASHEGALEANGITIAVTGTGLDRVYPARHHELAHRIRDNGALISEFPPGTPVLPGNFPRRNCIISGLSAGTLVVEAALKSGSLITARLASEQGREVFAIPGSIHNPLARGCHQLIRQGAKLVESSEDIIEELSPLLGTLIPDTGETPPRKPDSAPRQLDDEYLQLLGNIGFDPIHADQLIERSGLPPETVSSMLLLLELEGYVSSLSGGRFCLTGKN